MLLQTNSYVVPKDKRAEHARLMKRFKQVLGRLGCEDFEVHEQVGPNWVGGEPNPRVVQIMRFRDRKHHAALQAAEKTDPAAQQLIAEFCELVNFQYQQQQGFFAVGFYNSILNVSTMKGRELAEAPHENAAEVETHAPAEEALAEEPAADESPSEVAAESHEYAAEELAEEGEPGHLAESETSHDPEMPVELNHEGQMPGPLSEQELLNELGGETAAEHPLPEEPAAPVEVPEVEAPRRSSLFKRRK